MREALLASLLRMRSGTQGRRPCQGRYAVDMSAIPEMFRAYVAERIDDADGPRVDRGVREFAASDLPEGEVEVRIQWSSVNFKDGLATRVDGKVARINPLIPGIDLAGTVVSSADPKIALGTSVVAHGYDLGVARHGGYAEYERVPAGWVVPLADGLSTRDAMAIGTAGFTAAMSVDALEDHGLRPGDGPVLVTGASGGVGSVAVAILAQRGHEVWAATGKADEGDRLRALGAVGILGRDEVTGEGKPLESERWSGAVDAVGAATLPYVLRTLRRGAAVASSGNASGPKLDTTVFPFILRGVAMLGMDSVAVPIERRRAIWDRLAGDLRPRDLGTGVTEVSLDTLDTALDAILAGEARGRWVVRVGSG
jgi:acrylyl-CoA reductase (NADPH)